jgi:hypothetical protein
LHGRFVPLQLVCQVWGADSTSTASSDVTNVLGPSRSKVMTVRARVAVVVTPTPKTAWLTRCPSSSAGPLSAATTGATGSRGADDGAGVLGRN